MRRQLKEKEYDILQLLIHAEKPLTALEITKTDKALTVNTVQAILRNLIKMDLVKVSEIVYSGNVLARSFCPSDNATEVLQQLFLEDVTLFHKVISKEALLTAMLQANCDEEEQHETIAVLEQLLEEYKIGKKN